MKRWQNERLFTGYYRLILRDIFSSLLVSNAIKNCFCRGVFAAEVIREMNQISAWCRKALPHKPNVNISPFQLFH